MSAQFSISPEGEKFPLPAPDQYPAEFERLSKLAEQQRAKGREIVHRTGGTKILQRIAEAVEDISTIEQSPKQEGRHLTMILVSKGKKKEIKSATAAES